MKKSISFVILGLALSIVSCQDKKTTKEELLPMGVSKIVAKETFNAGGYTYINGKNGVWLAVGQTNIELNKAYYYQGALEMKNFHSKELNRDFPQIYFLNAISDTPVFTSKPKTMSASKMEKQVNKKIEVQLDKKEGITSIADVYKNQKELSGKQITVSGKVAKFNKNIMGKNWIHIQDGSDFKGNYDLTITSMDVTSVGEIVELTGMITLNKDFGAGYSYAVIMEEAKLSKSIKK